MRGLGPRAFNLAVYVEIPPPQAIYGPVDELKALAPGQLTELVQQCSNHWRKLFNCYAKLSFALDTQGFTRWQALRDEQLLQAHDHCALLFDLPQLHRPKCIHLIAGRGWAKTLRQAGLAISLTWLNRDFAVDRERQVIVCPFFDYRQLSNAKLDALVRCIQALKHGTAMPALTE